MTLVGMVFLVSGFSAASSHMVGGVLSDRFGRRPVLLGGAGIGAVLFAVLAVVIGISAPVWAIVIVYIAGRLVMSTVRPSIWATVADFSPEERLTEAYGLVRVGGNLGFAIGPAVGGYLLTFLPYTWLFWLAAFTSVIGFGFILFCLRESLHGISEKIHFRRMFADRTFLMLTGVAAILCLAMGQFGSTLSVFTVDRMGFSTAQFGLLLTTNGLLIVLFQYPAARGIGRLAEYKGLILGSLLYGFGFLSLSWAGSFGWTIGSVAVITAGEIVFAPLSLAVVAALAPQDQRGQYMGFFALSEMIGRSFGPLVGGVLLDTFPTDPPLVWGPIAFVALIAAVGFYWWGMVQRASQHKNHAG